MARTILIVDDTSTCGDTLEVALHSIPGIDVSTVLSAHEAMKVLEGGSNVAAVITDLHMPRMDGFELITCIRAQERFRAVPIIVISGDSDAGTPERLRRLGADAFFAKPFSPSAVRHTLEQYLYAK